MLTLSDLTIMHAKTRIATAGYGTTDGRTMTLRMVKWWKINGPTQAKWYEDQVVKVSGTNDDTGGPFSQNMVIQKVGDHLNEVSLRPMK